MKIRTMTASFGTLDGRSLELGDGLNILYAPNESGKSTWCAFLRTMLYGLNTAERERQGVKPDKVKYQPWSGTPMAGSLELESGGRAITLRRWTAKANQPMQEFSATYTGTEDPVPELTADSAGERLTGVSREVFERSAFIRQAGMSVSNSAELERRINAIVTTGEEGLAYSEVDKRLRGWQRHRRSGKRGAIPELENEMTQTGETLCLIRQASEEALALEEELEQARQERERAREAMQEARARQRRRALEEMSENRRLLEQREAAQSEAAARLEEQDEALRRAVFAGKPPQEARAQAQDVQYRAGELGKMGRKKPPLWLSWVFLALCALLLGAAAVLDWRTPLLAGGLVSLLLFALTFLRFQDMKKTARETLLDRDKVLASLGAADEAEVDALLDGYLALWQEREAQQASLEALGQELSMARERQKEADFRLVSGLDFTHGDTEAARAGQAVEELDRRIASLRERRAEAEGKARALGDPMVLESELAAQRTRLQQLNGQYDALTLAIETMAAADAELQSRFSPQLSKKAAEYFHWLTDGKYDEVTVAKDLSAKARLRGETVGRETEFLSEGAADQLYFALRLAVCELALGGGEPCPMVLDDALVNFDELRLARALELIRKLAESRQILLFTCHDREYNYLMDDPAATVIPVGE